MEEIFLNFTKIEWWFNGLFFAFIASIIPFIYSRVIVYLGENIIKKPIRRRKAKLLKRVKKIRGDDIKINYEISKNTAFLTAFILSAVIYTACSGIVSILVVFPVKDVSDIDYSYLNVWSFACFPIFIVEILYLRSRFFINILLSRRNRLLRRKA